MLLQRRRLCCEPFRGDGTCCTHERFEQHTHVAPPTMVREGLAALRERRLSSVLPTSTALFANCCCSRCCTRTWSSSARRWTFRCPTFVVHVADLSLYMLLTCRCTCLLYMLTFRCTCCTSFMSRTARALRCRLTASTCTFSLYVYLPTVRVHVRDEPRQQS